MTRTYPDRLRYFDKRLKIFYTRAEIAYLEGKTFTTLALAAIGEKDTITSLIAEARTEGISEESIVNACPFYYSIK